MTERRAEWERIALELYTEPLNPGRARCVIQGPTQQERKEIKAIADALAAQFNAGVEAAAALCDTYETKRWLEYKEGHGPGRANPWNEGASDGAGECATAIRALKEVESE